MIGRWIELEAISRTHFMASTSRPRSVPGSTRSAIIESGEQVAFGYAANVAQALSNLLPPPSKRGWPFFRRIARPRYQSGELEYRTWPTRLGRRGESSPPIS